MKPVHITRHKLADLNYAAAELAEKIQENFEELWG